MTFSSWVYQIDHVLNDIPKAILVYSVGVDSKWLPSGPTGHGTG